MGIEHASARDKEKKKNSVRDFYQTPKKAVEILAKFLQKNRNIPRNKILDPCCGELAISSIIEKYFINIKKYDLFPKNENIKKFDFFDEKEKFDLIVMNPPYSKKKEFIRHSLTISNNVFVFLPLQVMNYIDFTEEFLNSRYYSGQIIVYPKMILNETQNYKQGGLTAYAWFYFTNNYYQDNFQIFEDIRNY